MATSRGIRASKGTFSSHLNILSIIKCNLQHLETMSMLLAVIII